MVISLIAFIISNNAPGDPLDTIVSSSLNHDEGVVMNTSKQDKKDFWRTKLGLNLPIFYFSIHPLSEPDTLYRIFNKDERKALERLLDGYGNWIPIQSYYNAINKFSDAVNETINDSLKIPVDLKFEVHALKTFYDDITIQYKLNKVRDLLVASGFSSMNIFNLYNDLRSKYEEVKSTKTSWKNYVPTVTFYGTKNQYHRWLLGDEFVNSKGILRGDFGTSYITKQPISEIIYNRLGWTIYFSLSSIILAYLFSIPIGIKAAAKKGKTFDKISSVILFLMYSLPVFWTATLLLMTFANPDVFSLFKPSGVKPTEGLSSGDSLLQKIMVCLPYLVLPTICYTYSSIAFISRTIRVSMMDSLSQDYIRTARAKGLSEHKVIYKHAFRNSLFPIITMFANIFPLVVSGSVILEYIFSIPGMGTEVINAIDEQNYPMIIAVFTLTGFLTLIGYLVSDILYAMADPRIKHSIEK
ncbi:MAG: ABC transporter permease [Bacteroidota bacterium]